MSYNPTKTESPTQAQRLGGETPGTARSFQYQATNPDILADFAEEAPWKIYGHVPPSILAEFPLTEEGDLEERRPIRSLRDNPSEAVIRPQQNGNNMTAAFLQRQERELTVDMPDHSGDELRFVPTIIKLPPYADISSFGLRYRSDTKSSKQILVTNKRIPAEISNSNKDCIICTETKNVFQFPSKSITKSCTHPPTACKACISTSITTDLKTKSWRDIRCPECREPLQYDEVQKYADPESLERYVIRHIPARCLTD